jgi:hypothetical protein
MSLLSARRNPDRHAPAERDRLPVAGGLAALSLDAQAHSLQTVGVFLLLRAFANGCAALTGVEAIANAVPSFRRPRVRRAQRAEVALLARDNHLPHLFALRAERQVHRYGISFLVTGALLLIGIGGDMNTLVPLFAVGVFVGFTLSQAGMVRHWWTDRPYGWRPRAALNGLGALLTGLAAIIVTVTKFPEGGWLIVVTMPLLVCRTSAGRSSPTPCAATSTRSSAGSASASMRFPAARRYTMRSGG